MGEQHSRQKEKHPHVPDIEARWEVQERARVGVCLEQSKQEEGLSLGSSGLRIHVQMNS